ncbi:hypothetical protein, partial [Rhodopseudomonas sp. BR0M22]|uniref:hypothetical protein n=1 Tax=Rhodopseudomonas sp. BR0M22 TaxID=2269369 RepID=UPI00196797A7
RVGIDRVPHLLGGLIVRALDVGLQKFGHVMSRRRRLGRNSAAGDRTPSSGVDGLGFSSDLDLIGLTARCVGNRAKPELRLAHGDQAGRITAPCAAGRRLARWVITAADEIAAD